MMSVDEIDVIIDKITDIIKKELRGHIERVPTGEHVWFAFKVQGTHPLELEVAINIKKEKKIS